MVFIGDTHGDNDVIKFNIINNKYKDTNLIHVGDYGIGFRSEEVELERLESLNKFLKKLNNTLHIFRGNHDNPKYFNGDYILSNLKLHKDYSVLNINNKKILGIGGAISIDRVPRQMYRNAWWEGEVFNLKKDILKDIRNIDILVTHSAPTYCPPSNENGYPDVVTQFTHNDETLIEELNNERETIKQAIDILLINNKPTHHFYGHFHRHFEYTDKGITHICLDIDEFYNLNNI